MDRHDTLLLCSGSAENRNLIRETISRRYNLLETSNTRQALLLLRQNVDCIATVLLDISVPQAIDQDLLRQEESQMLLSSVPSIVLTKTEAPELVSLAYEYGASDVIPLDYESNAMLRRIETIVELFLHKQYLETKVREQADQLHDANERMVDVLSSIIEYRSVESGQHILRIRHFTKILLDEVVRSCPEYRLDETIIPVIASAAALHDIGKIAIPDAILMKPGPLTQQEREIMKTHALTGCRILESLGNVGEPRYLRYAHNICHYHHERWDGSGYPEGLSGDQIPICAQVVGLADAYDALTSKRVYKEAYSFSRAVNMILKGECGAFSPQLLECFKHVTDAYESLARAYADGLSPESETFDAQLPLPVQREENSLERVRAKYFALVHYIGGLLMEVDLEKNLFHLIYNPYPELGWLQEVATFPDMIKLLNKWVADRKERRKALQIFRDEIGKFVEMDLRRVTKRVRLRSRQKPEGEFFEITLLRINPIEANRRTLAVLCRRVDKEQGQLVLPDLPTGSILRCRNDEAFTLLELGGHVPILAGYTREELKQVFSNQLMAMILPEDRKMVQNAFREQFLRGNSAEVELRIRHKDGSLRWILDKSQLCLGSDGQEYLNVFLTDITHTKQDQDALREKLERYEIILAQTENVLFQWDISEDVLTFSDTWEKIFGFLPMRGNARIRLAESAHLHPDDLPMLMDRISSLENGSSYESVEVRISTAKGRYIWCRIRASAVPGIQGKLEKVVGIIINIDAEKQAARQLQDRAERDSLTKLLNKNAVRRQAEEYLARFPGGASCAMLIIDLDNFKQVNDQYGHLFGDAVLTRAAREIEKLFRNQDIVARIGGDEFLVLMRGVSERPLLENRCQRLLQNFRNIFHNYQFQLPLSCSIGISLSPEHGISYYDLYNHADQALYQAKRQGKNTYEFYDSRESRFSSRQDRVVAATPIDSDREPGLAENNIVRYAFQRLYSSREPKTAIQEILALIGEKMKVSRVYVFENSDDNRYCSNTYEWCAEGICPEMDNLQNVSYDQDIPGYREMFNEQGIFYCQDVSTLPREYYEILEPQGVKSLLQCAIRDGAEFRGYIGFDECVEHRFWTKEQIQTLTFFSEMLGLYLLKQRQQEQIQSHADDLRTILDNQDAWIYIIDPDTCRLKYVNAKTTQLSADVKTGMLCYKALMGREERCPGCPSLNIRREKNGRSNIWSSRFGMEIQADATLIRWKGEESCLLSCRELQKERAGTEEN